MHLVPEERASAGDVLQDAGAALLAQVAFETVDLCDQANQALRAVRSQVVDVLSVKQGSGTNAPREGGHRQVDLEEPRRSWSSGSSSCRFPVPGGSPHGP